MTLFLNTLKLLLPALIPSWNFFDVIAPSPRIEYTLLNSQNESVTDWQEFRPRPEQLSFIQLLFRLLLNPRWNETLFMVSCAERILQNPTEYQHSENEILNRIISEFIDEGLNKSLIAATQLQFRLLTIQRQDEQLIHDINFESRIQKLPGISLTSGDDV